MVRLEVKSKKTAGKHRQSVHRLIFICIRMYGPPRTSIEDLLKNIDYVQVRRSEFIIHIPCQALKIDAQSRETRIVGAIEIRDEELPPPPPPKEKRKLIWSGEVTPQKWMNLYTKVLTKFVKEGEINLNVSIEASPVDGVTDQHVEETKAALRELGLDENVTIK